MMMIRINLLPVRQVKKRVMGRQYLVLVAGAVLVAAGINFIWWNSRNDVLERKQQQVKDTQARIQELEKVIGEVNNLKKRKDEVEAKLKVLSDLSKSRSGPVKMLDALSVAIPKKVWLKDFVESNSNVKVTGMALSHDDVAELMRGLSGIVWTPKGMGRLIERKRDAKNARVELLGSEGVLEDFPVADISSFFTNIDLRKAALSAGGAKRRVDFEITMKANYAI